jgi:hypothetical protein
VDALSNPQVAKYINEHFVSAYLKVGAFRIINGQKVGGNVASYFCVPEGGVLHAIPGKTDADTLLKEARWTLDIRKSAFAISTNPENGNINLKRFAGEIRKAHTERFKAENRIGWGGDELPVNMPNLATPQAKAHWLLARNPAARLELIYPTVWQRILGEQLSALPVQKQ